MKLYLAGPDVFRPDIHEWARSAREACRRFGYEPLVPIDHGETEAPRIFKANLDLIRSAQAVVANLNPFRGAEPDSGTCFELGYAMALGKKIFGYVERMETLQERVNRIEGAEPARTIDNQCMVIEDFKLPLNLMLAVPAMIVEGGLEDCLRQMDGRHGTATVTSSRPAGNPAARNSHEAAVRYLRWVADGRIKDGNAVATVAEQYKVGEDVVRGWLEAWSGIALASLADYRPDDIVRQMRISGRQFRSLK